MRMKQFVCALQVAIAVLPSWLKIPLYRVFFGYEIGRGVRIGFSPIVGVRRLSIGDGTRVGWFNVFYRVEQVVIGRQVKVGFLNCFRGGQSIRIGDYCSILRMNTMNAIINGDFISPIEPTLEIGAGAVITTAHWLDFSAGIRMGDHVILGGRNSSLWTHNRQIGKPISVASHTYLGSEVRLAPGVTVAPFCVVALGSVLSGRFDLPRSLIGGNPGRVVRALSQGDLFLVTRKTRRDIPDEFEMKCLPDDLRVVACHSNDMASSSSWGGDQEWFSDDRMHPVSALTQTSGEVA
jgi:acetyltransferase-like isoleucine patch superfamily enzyme